jgi:hypothetical protein
MAESLSSSMLWGMFLFFVGLWAAILAVGYLLSSREDVLPEPATPITPRLKKS